MEGKTGRKKKAVTHLSLLAHLSGHGGVGGAQRATSRALAARGVRAKEPAKRRCRLLYSNPSRLDELLGFHPMAALIHHSPSASIYLPVLVYLFADSRA
jgi:hypothetical protein